VKKFFKKHRLAPGGASVGEDLPGTSGSHKKTNAADK